MCVKSVPKGSAELCSSCSWRASARNSVVKWLLVALRSHCDCVWMVLTPHEQAPTCTCDQRVTSVDVRVSQYHRDIKTWLTDAANMSGWASFVYLVAFRGASGVVVAWGREELRLWPQGCRFNPLDWQDKGTAVNTAVVPLSKVLNPKNPLRGGCSVARRDCGCTGCECNQGVSL